MVYSERDSTQKDTYSSAVTSSLSDLIARLEKAQGPDRELDAEIAASIRDCPSFSEDWVKNWAGEWRAINGLVHLLGDFGSSGNFKPRPYTSSIDAAMTMIPPNFLHMIGSTGLSDGDKEYRGDVWGLRPGSSHIGLHDCEAIALCIAALKARSPQSDLT